MKRGLFAADSRYSLPSCLGTAVGLRLAAEIAGTAGSSVGFGTIDPVAFEAVVAAVERSAYFETIGRALFVGVVVLIEGMGSTRVWETQSAP